MQLLLGLLDPWLCSGRTKGEKELFSLNHNTLEHVFGPHWFTLALCFFRPLSLDGFFCWKEQTLENHTKHPKVKDYTLMWLKYQFVELWFIFIVVIHIPRTHEGFLHKIQTIKSILQKSRIKFNTPCSCCTWNQEGTYITRLLSYAGAECTRLAPFIHHLGFVWGVNEAFAFGFFLGEETKH